MALKLKYDLSCVKINVSVRTPVFVRALLFALSPYSHTQLWGPQSLAHCVGCCLTVFLLMFYCLGCLRLSVKGRIRVLTIFLHSTRIYAANPKRLKLTGFHLWIHFLPLMLALSELKCILKSLPWFAKHPTLWQPICKSQLT